MQSVKVLSYEYSRDDVLSLSGLGDGHNVTHVFDLAVYDNTCYATQFWVHIHQASSIMCRSPSDTIAHSALQLLSCPTHLNP